MAGISPATIEDAYQHYATSQQPSYQKTADAFGVSQRLVQEWATLGRWRERYREDQERMVAAIRHNADIAINELLPRAITTLGELLDAESESVRFQAARHILGLRGYIVNTRTESRNVSVVQHVRSNAGDAGSGDALDAFRSRVAELVQLEDPVPLTPGDYREEREEDDERVPTTRVDDDSDGSGPTVRIDDDSEHSGGDDVDDGTTTT